MWKVAERLALAEHGMKVLEELDWNEERAATAGQGLVRMRYSEGGKRSSSCQT